MNTRGNVLIKIDDLTVGYDSTAVLSGVTLEVFGGEFLGIVGPNGSGKTTLLRSVARVLRPRGGAVFIDGKEVFSIPASSLARQVGVTPQDTAPAFDFTALEIVLMGRSVHLGRFQSEGAKDLAIAEESMRRTGTLDFAFRQFASLSGGERQRVVIARALAQEPRILLLDEPTSHLDINYQFEILNLIQRLNLEQCITVITVLHDLNLAAQYCSRLVMLGEGRIQALGTPVDVLTAENLRMVYGVEVWVRRHPTSGRPYVITGVDRPLSNGDMDSFERRMKVHVICGGGTGAPIFAKLLRRGCEVTAGVLNIGDTDQEAAEALGVEYISAPPFTPIPEDASVDNFNTAREADVIVVSDAPFGAWNLPNLMTIMALAQEGKPLILLRPDTIKQRDFTGGEAAKILESLILQARCASTLDELVSAVDDAVIM